MHALHLRGLLVLGVLGCGPASGPELPADSSGEVVDTQPEAPGSWRSVLYPEDWTPEHTTPDGLFLHDFSYAGYRAGEVDPPLVLPAPVVRVQADVTGQVDAADAIQLAIDGLADGGTVLLPAGDYTVSRRLEVVRSGVVIAGEGSTRTRVHFTQSEGTTSGSGMRFSGAAAPVGEGWLLAEDGEARSHEVVVADPSGLEPGMAVALGWTITDDFRRDHGMASYWDFAAGSWRTFFRRTVVSVEGAVVTLDVPLRYPAGVRDGASLRPDEGYLTEVGVVGLAVSTAVSTDAALAADRHHALHMLRVADAWMRDVRSFAPVGSEAHLQSGGIYVEASRRVTLMDLELGRAQHRGEGGNGYLVEISRSSEVLVRDAIARDGRHNFIQNWDFSTNGCVFLRTHSEGGRAENGPITVRGLSEFHHALAMANLIDDSTADDGWQCKNRRSYSSGAGHAGTQNVFWRTRGAGELWSMQQGVGYVIGTGDELQVFIDPASLDLTFGGLHTEPEDYAEGVGLADSLVPPSLYEDQLARRMGRR